MKVQIVFPSFQSEDTPVLKASVRAVCKLYVKLVREHYSWLVPAGAKRRPQRHGATDKVTQQYHDWMRKNYTVCLDRLLQLVRHDDHNVQVCIANTMSHSSLMPIPWNGVWARD